MIFSTVLVAVSMGVTPGLTGPLLPAASIDVATSDRCPVGCDGDTAPERQKSGFSPG